MRIDIVADFTCPWCYIGKRRLERALATRPRMPVRLVWRPFQLNPELPAGGVARQLYLQVKFGSGRSASRIETALKLAGAQEGIDFAFERIRRTPNTLNAHRLVRMAGAAGYADAVVERLFRGYFCQGVDIGDIDALARIAGSAGLDRETIRARLAGSAEIAAVLADEAGTRRSGIDAVPCFVIAGDFALAGAQDPEAFVPLFDLAVVSRLPVEA
jgi:predicted DsbA family dithiol-disulfide isomerase